MKKKRKVMMMVLTTCAHQTRMLGLTHAQRQARISGSALTPPTRHPEVSTDSAIEKPRRTGEGQAGRCFPMGLGRLEPEAALAAGDDRGLAGGQPEIHYRPHACQAPVKWAKSRDLPAQ